MQTILFGNGDKSVSFGTIDDKPAVFIERAKEVGKVGEYILPKPDKTNLDADAIILLFPTIEQAQKVADAICNSESTKESKHDQ